MRRLLVTRRVTVEIAARARREFDAMMADHDMTAEEVVSATIAQGSEAVLSGPKARLTAEHIAALPDSIRIIANPSAGYDHMDPVAAAARGIVVTNAPDVLTDCTPTRSARRGPGFPAPCSKAF
jgi:lactate dehydrogenase-like 2-hydroxyacid dehydrogenase